MLSKRHIIDFADYAESKDFLLLYDFLLRHKTKILPRNPAWPSLNSLEKLSWKADARTVISDPGKKRQITSIAMIHDAFHQVLADTYPSQSLQGMPRTILLSECLASCLDVYFSLMYFNASGWEHREPQRYLKIISRKNDKSLDSIARAFNQGAKSPFRFYKMVALEMYDYLEVGLRYCLSKGAPKEQSKARRMHKKLKYLSFYSSFDFEVFFLYVFCHSGLKSSIQDRKHVKKLLKFLRESDSFVDLFQNLEDAAEPSVQRRLKSRTRLAVQ